MCWQSVQCGRSSARTSPWPHACSRVDHELCAAARSVQQQQPVTATHHEQPGLKLIQQDALLADVVLGCADGQRAHATCHCSAALAANVRRRRRERCDARRSARTQQRVRRTRALRCDCRVCAVTKSVHRRLRLISAYSNVHSLSVQACRVGRVCSDSLSIQLGRLGQGARGPLCSEDGCAPGTRGPSCSEGGCAP